MITSFWMYLSSDPYGLPSFPTRRSSDLADDECVVGGSARVRARQPINLWTTGLARSGTRAVGCRRMHSSTTLDARSEEHTSELQSRRDLVCRLLLEKKKR